MRAMTFQKRWSFMWVKEIKDYEARDGNQRIA